MQSISAFFAYPSRPDEIREPITRAITRLQDMYGYKGVRGWEQSDIPGRFIVDPIFQTIASADVLIADITRLNFNVTFEIGYAIGKRKRVHLIKNTSVSTDEATSKAIGIFDTLGHSSYANSESLITLVRGIDDVDPLRFSSDRLENDAPIYVVRSQSQLDSDIRIMSRIKKARLPFRSFDPQEYGRMSALDAIQQVASSYGVVVSLVTSNRPDYQITNLRAAFVAGLAMGMDKELLMLQEGDEPIPLDYRDLVAVHRHLDQINDNIADFVARVTAHLIEEKKSHPVYSTTLLNTLPIGASVAENELRTLNDYFMQTDEFQRTLRGDVQIVTGRKGSGKTAMFLQVRDHLRASHLRHRVILDLRPEGFQLRKFKDIVLHLLEDGTKEHVITAFWEYLLLLEMCHKLIEKDRAHHLADHTIYESYRSLEVTYSDDATIREGDFAERMLLLLNRIGDDFEKYSSISSIGITLGRDKITELLYRHDVPALRRDVFAYLKKKAGVWVLIDNLDKGWATHGVKAEDVLILRCLLDALSKLARECRKESISGYGAVFVRNDVYDLLVDNTPDRGKYSKASVDWDDPDLLREMLRLRFVSTHLAEDTSFETIWGRICVSHIDGEESSQYLIDRCLMRPRALLDLLACCRSHAVNMSRDRINVDDIKRGEESFSTELIANISFEIRDIDASVEDVLYAFIGSDAWVTAPMIEKALLDHHINPDSQRNVVRLLLWYGVLGIVRDNDEECYIYNVKYDMRRLMALIQKKAESERVFCLNKAFWAGLEIRPPSK